MEIICFLLKPCISISKTQFSRKLCGRTYVRVYFSAQGIHLCILRESMLIKWFYDTSIEIRSKRWIKKIRKVQCRYISLYYLWKFVIFHYLLQSVFILLYIGFYYITRYCSRNFHYVSKHDKKEKNIEIIVLWERREVIGRMALEPCNYPAILSLSEWLKLAKQTWNGHYVFPISALTSK